MNAAALLNEVASRGVDVEVVGDRLRLKPKSKLDPELLDQLRDSKPEILRLVLERRCDVCLAVAAQGHLTLICGCGYQHPKVRVLHALDSSPKTLPEIQKSTGLSVDAVRHELERLMGYRSVATDGQSFKLVEGKP